MGEELAKILAYCRDNGRVCPMPMRWNELYQLLPETRRLGVGWEPPLPPILAAWHHASDAQKQDRLEIHIRWASEHKALNEISAFLQALPESDWHHVGD